MLYDNKPTTPSLYTGAPIVSLPALAAAIRTTGAGSFALPGPLPQPPLVMPMYRVLNGSIEREAQSAAVMVEQIAERMRRLASAYGEWRVFDVEAYFDLTSPLAAQLVRIVERVSTVHVTFFVDLLLPSYQRAAAFWAGQFAASYAAAIHRPAAAPYFDDDFFLDTQPAMRAYWEQLTAVVEETRGYLMHEPGYLAANAALQERARWRSHWATAPAAGLDPALLPALEQVPTLTLTTEFPLPVSRQPGRLRRLRRQRDRRRRRGKR